jgi:hypothetical protein
MEEVDRKKIEQMFLGRPVECLFPGMSSRAHSPLHMGPTI